MVTKQKVSRADRLAALRDKLKTADIGGRRSGWFNPKTGRNVVRILPEVGDMEYFYQPVGKHQLPGDKQVHCPSFTSEGELPCPVCEIVDQLYKAGDKGSKNLADQLRVRKKFWMNVIDRNNEDAGPLIFPAGPVIFGAISTIIADPDYGDIMDVETGIDLVIERSGEGLSTEYQVNPRRNDSPLSDDDDTAQKWLDNARDLSYVEVSEDPEEDQENIGNHSVWVLPYERIVREFDLDNLEEDFDEDGEEDVPVPQDNKRKAVKPKAKAPVEEEEEEEVVEEEQPAKREVVRRMARRSRR